MKVCCYCNETLPDSICRPYGPEAAYCCFPCGVKPENEPETLKQLGKKIDAIIASNPAVVTIGGTDGPTGISHPKKDPHGPN